MDIDKDDSDRDDCEEPEDDDNDGEAPSEQDTDEAANRGESGHMEAQSDNASQFTHNRHHVILALPPCTSGS